MKIYIIVSVVLISIIGWFGYTMWQKKQSASLNRTDDKVFVSYDLDGLANIKVPQSFEQNKKYTIANFYTLDPIKNKFIYSFYLQRAEFNDYGGNAQKPVILSLTVYNTQVSFDDWNYYIDNLQTGSASEINGATEIKNNVVLQKTETTEVDKLNFVAGYSADHPDATLLVYSYQNSNQKYRLGLLYWTKYLTDDAAAKLLEDTVSSIVIKDTLSSRVKTIVDVFYKKYPNKKP